MIAFTANAQENDTTIYNGCKQSDDTINVVGNPAILDRCPQFENNLTDLYKYISAHIRYGAISKLPDKETKVIIETVIEKDGSLSHTKVLRHVSGDLDKEATRVVNALPIWHLGILHDKKVRVRYLVVVSFKTKKIE